VTWDDSTNTNKGTITIRKAGAPATFAVFTVSGSVSDNTTWLQIAVTHVASNGALSAGDDLYLSFARTGDKGADGTGSGDMLASAYPTLVSLEGLSLASGDILYATAADTLARLPKGSDGEVLMLASGAPDWVNLLATDQTWSGSQRGAITTDNDGSFDLNVSNNFFCTTAGSTTLTFTNHAQGQSGLILFVNASNHAVSAAATTKIKSADLTTISATGTYLLTYFDSGTNAYVVASGALT
jgi:hypothetical protein